MEGGRAEGRRERGKKETDISNSFRYTVKPIYSLLAASMNDLKVFIGMTESGSSLRKSFKQPVTILMSAHWGSSRST